MTELIVPKTKSELFQTVYATHGSLERVLNRLTDAQLLVPGADGWAIKDHLAHITAWEQGLIALLQKKSRYAAMGLSRDEWTNLDAVGAYALIFERNISRSRAQARAACYDSYRQLLDALDRLDDADLTKTQSQYDPNAREESQRTIIDSIAGDSYGHYVQHSGWIQQLIDEKLK